MLMVNLIDPTEVATIPDKSSRASDNACGAERPSIPRSTSALSGQPIGSRPLMRRTFLGLLGALSLCPAGLIADVRAQPVESKKSLLKAPLELAGAWPSSPPEAVIRVLARMREACLFGVKLVSDRQPDRLRVDNHADGLPAIWLHTDPADTAWIIVNIGPHDWSKLAYQFGHELGH